MGTEFVFIMVALAAAVNANVGDECDMHELSNACGESRGFICVEKEDDSDKGTCQCRVGYKESNGVRYILLSMICICYQNFTSLAFMVIPLGRKMYAVPLCSRETSYP